MQLTKTLSKWSTSKKHSGDKENEFLEKLGNGLFDGLADQKNKKDEITVQNIPSLPTEETMKEIIGSSKSTTEIASGLDQSSEKEIGRLVGLCEQHLSKVSTFVEYFWENNTTTIDLTGIGDVVDNAISAKQTPLEKEAKTESTVSSPSKSVNKISGEQKSFFGKVASGVSTGVKTVAKNVSKGAVTAGTGVAKGAGQVVRGVRNGTWKGNHRSIFIKFRNDRKGSWRSTDPGVAKGVGTAAVGIAKRRRSDAWKPGCKIS